MRALLERIAERSAWILVGIVGIAAIRIVSDDSYLQWITQRMWPLLLAAGVAVLLLAVAADVTCRPGSAIAAQRIRLMLFLAPAAAAVVVSPIGFGGTTDTRTAGAFGAAVGDGSFGSLPAAVDGAIPMELGDLLERDWFAADDDRLDGRRIRLVGMTAPYRDGVDDGGPTATGPVSRSGEELAVLQRYRVACCLADALLMQVVLTGTTADIAPGGSWVEVVGTAEPSRRTAEGKRGLARLRVEAITTIPAPRIPYE